MELKRQLDPRGVEAMVEQVRAIAGGRPTLVVVPWMSAATRARVVDAGVNLVELTGGTHIVLAEPGLFVDTSGAERDPWPDERRATLKGAKAAHVVRALCRRPPPYGVRELAAMAGTSPGYVSKLMTMLDQETALTRSEDGRVGSVDLSRLLQRWAEDAPLASRARTTTWIDARGLPAFLRKLASTKERYAVTASLAATRRAPVAAPRLATVYVDDPDAASEALGLRSADAGANVLLLAPNDDFVFEDAWEDEGVRFAALPQVAADLLSGPGRGPAEAEALIAWMTKNPEAWRG